MTCAIWLRLCFLAIMAAGAAGQLIGCPLQWETYKGHCYQFVFGERRDYEEAATACWVQGSALVSVNDIAEHQFITKFLNSHGQKELSEWYTSGEYRSGAIKWYGDGTYTNNTSDPIVWRSSYDYTLPGKRIVYKYSPDLRQYGWSKAEGDSELNYICEIPQAEISRIVQQDRDFGYGLSGDDLLNIPKGPHFLGESDNLVVVGDRQIAIECFTTGNPLPVYTWYKSSYDVPNLQGILVYTQITSDSNKRYTITNGRLSISEPSDSKDAGLYQCRAENEYGSILSPPIQLSFGNLNQFSPNQQGFVEAKQNLGTFINCNAPSAKPALSYNWYKGRADNFVRPELTKYYFISANGNLYFSEVQLTDGGNYFCAVTLSARVGESLSNNQPPGRTSRPIELRVQGAASLEYGPIIHNDFIGVYPKPPLVGYEVRLECFAYGRMPLRYSWSRDNKQFPDGTRFEYDNRVMIIPKAKFKDGGKYNCKVEKLSGVQKTVEKSFILTMEAKPYFVFPLRDLHADEGKELTWRCEAQAVPRAIYSWYKNSKLLQSIPGQLEIRENVLVIKNLDKSRDPGMYQCSATNAHGTSFSTAQLRVMSFKPSFAKYPLPSSTVASVGGNFTLSCTPEAAPQPDIAWFHNGQPIGYGNNRVQVFMDGSLHVSQVTQGDQGAYMCKASNSNGEDQSTTQVIVARGLSFITRPSNNRSPVNKTHFFYCEVGYDYNRYELTYVWKFNGRIIDTRRDFFYRMESDDHKKGLYIVNAQFRHSGTYECIGQTVLSSLSASADLVITGPPGEPAGVYVESTLGVVNNSVTVFWTWNPAANNGFPVDFFDIEGYTTHSNTWNFVAADIPAHETVIQAAVDNTRRRYHVVNLLSFNSYKFRVRAKNVQGVGPASSPSGYYKVPASAPTRAPRDVGGGGGSVGTLKITWQPLSPAEEGGKNFGYKVYWRMDGERTSFVEEIAGNVSTYSIQVGKNNYYRPYNVKVQAYNEKGEGPESAVAKVYSAEGMPMISPKNVRYNSINGTSLQVTWDQVPNNRSVLKGEVLGYRINYYPRYDTDDWNKSVNVYCQCGSGVLVGLQPNGYYYVRVSVFTRAGYGVQSEQYLTSLNENPPGRYPQYVDIKPHGLHSVQVKWRGVDQVYGEASLLGYKLWWWPVGDDLRSANVTTTGKETNTVITGLQHDIIYKLRVMGYNRGGDGKKSPTVYFSVTNSGAININTANFDPSTSQIMLAGSSRHLINHCLLLFSLGVILFKSVEKT